MTGDTPNLPVTSAPPPVVVPEKRGLPVGISAPQAKEVSILPNATVVYGIGASLLFVVSVSLARSGQWFAALLVFALGGCLTGFALHLLKHRD